MRQRVGDFVITRRGSTFSTEIVELNQITIRVNTDGAPVPMRFGITPLYLAGDDIRRAAETLERVIRGRLYDRPEHLGMHAVPWRCAR